MTKNNNLELALDSFHNCLESLEEYIAKLNISNFKRIIYRRTIADSNDTEVGFEDLFLTQFSIMTSQVARPSIKNNPEYISIRQEVQKEFQKWIDATQITVDNCPDKLKYYLFSIDEMLEGRGEKFIQELREYVRKIEDSYKPEDFADIFRQTREIMNNRPNFYEVKIKGNAEKGKETFQTIVNSLSSEYKDNFHFFSSDYYQQQIPDEPSEEPQELTEEVQAHRQAAKEELTQLLKEKWVEPQENQDVSQALINEIDKAIEQLNEFKKNTTAHGGQNKWAWKELRASDKVLELEMNKIQVQQLLSAPQQQPTEKLNQRKEKKWWYKPSDYPLTWAICTALLFLITFSALSIYLQKKKKKNSF